MHPKFVYHSAASIRSIHQEDDAYCVKDEEGEGQHPRKQSPFFAEQGRKQKYPEGYDGKRDEYVPGFDGKGLMRLEQHRN